MPELGKEPLWRQVTQAGGACFRTDGDGAKQWRDLLAYQPTAGFVVEDISELTALIDFIASHGSNLCGGYFSYDLGRELMGVPTRHTPRFPLAVIYAFDSWVEYREGKAFQHGQPWIIDSFEDARSPETASLNFSPGLSKPAYASTINRIHEYIRAGDFYQLNFTQQLKVTSTGVVDYPGLLQKHPAAHAMSMHFDDVKIHSLSPELFLHYSEGRLLTEPIKGTRPRGQGQVEDDAFRQALMSSEKEQAELFMITDLLRNDLGMVCEVGSIALEAVKDIRKLPRVWHTFSRISGRLHQKLEPLEALMTMLPGGSITGCPKKHSMEIIDLLEGESRDIYTGNLGYFHPEGDFSFNIAIRTLVQKGKTLSLGSGGGITIDSHWEDEWQELLVKASTFK